VGVLWAVEAAGLPEGAGVEEGWAGALVAGTGAVRSGAVLADAGPTVPEPVPAEPAPEPVPAEPAPEPVPAEPAPEPVPAEPAPEPVPAEPVPLELARVELAAVGLAPVELAGELEPPEGADEPAEPADDAAELTDAVADDAVEPTDDVADDAVEPTDEVADDVAEPTAEVTGDVAEPTVEVTGDVAEPSVDEVPERVDVRVALRGDRAEVDAWAGRENSSMATKMPAPTSAACTAVRAMRRAIGCMSSPPRRETRRSPTLRRRSKPRAHGNAVRPPPYSPVGNRTRAGGRGEGPEPAAIAC
jgi:hypothetical protein